MEEIFIQDFGITLGKKSERLVIREKGKIVREIPFFKLSAVNFMSSGCSISVDAIKECVQTGIRINFLDFNGLPYAQLNSPNLTGTVKTRREQLIAYNDKRGVILAKAFVLGKLKNQINIIRYFSRYRKERDVEVFKALDDRVKGIEENINLAEKVDGKVVDDIRGELMGIEGRTGKVYWDAVKIIIADYMEFPGREHRGTEDPVNSLLNYGYGILNSKIWGAIILAGLEPFAGFLHVDRPGRPSLVFDLIEEFRQQVVDRVVISYITKGGKIEMEEGMIGGKTKKDFVQRILERLEAREKYGSDKNKLKNIIQKQAHSLAVYIREGERYRPFVGSW